MAAPITGTSGGSFSNLGSCDNSGGSQDCRIVNTAANGSNTQVQWGSTSSNTDFVNPSTLTAVDLAISTAVNATNVNIARLTWFNSATRSQEDLNSFDVDYNLSIAFTSPGNSSDSRLFDLTIVNPSNPPGDIISFFTLADLQSFSFNLPGWTISNLHYVADGGSTLCGNNNTSWCNPENNTGNLYIKADFTQTVPVPEPLTLSLFSAGLVGVATLRRRRKQTQA
jgi:hypothetical protein